MSEPIDYASPTVITVGTVQELTKGHGSPVGDSPNDGTTGYYNAAKAATDLDEVRLDD